MNANQKPDALEPHPLAQLYPALPAAEFTALVEDVRTYGVRFPIKLYEGQVLDGWHRYRAATALGIEAPSTTFTGTWEEAFAFVRSANQKRRHLTQSQLSLVAAKATDLQRPPGRPTDRNGPPGTISEREAARLFGVSKTNVNRAKLVLNKGTAAEITAIEAGKTSVKAIARKIKACTPPPLVLVPSRGAIESKRSLALPSYIPEAWRALDPAEQAAILTAGRACRTEHFNAQKTDDIEWAQWSWNPVTGCLHDCPYCYARDIAERIYPQGFVPTLWPARLGAPATTPLPPQAKRDIAYRNVFVVSMGDLFGRWVPSEWIQAVLDVVAAAPQWNFLFLTKFPKRYAEFTFPKNAWVGATVDCQARVKATEEAFAEVQATVKWLSIEPLLEPLRFTRLNLFQWLVFGGASKSTQTPEWRPPPELWVPVYAQAKAQGARIFQKSNLFVRERRWPHDGLQPARLPKVFDYLRHKTPADIVRGEQ